MLPFITAHDPIGSLGDSIDPLGFLQPYSTLVEELLPGVTTITTRARYLSVVCAGILNARKVDDFRGPAGIVALRHAVEPWERLWALACAAAAEAGARRAVDGLRGVRRVQEHLSSIRQRGVSGTPNYRLLLYQGRTGGVPTYWNALIAGRLLESNGELTSEGKALAQAFPSPPLSNKDLLRLAKPEDSGRVKLSTRQLESWGKECHLGAAKPAEKSILRDALQEDPRRAAIADALRAWRGRLPATWKGPDLWRLSGRLRGDAESPVESIRAAIRAIIALEKLHQSALACFDALRYWATTHRGNSLQQGASALPFRLGRAGLGGASRNVLSEAQSTESGAARAALLRITPFAQELGTARTARDVADTILGRHRQVQAGKLDGGSPKLDWITVSPSGRLVQPFVRYELADPPDAPDGKSLTHPYRLSQFVGMLVETRALQVRRLAGPA